MSATRRNLLGAAGAAALVSVPVVVNAAGDDPVLPLYRRWRALEDAQLAAEAKYRASASMNDAPALGNAPRDNETIRLMEEADRLNGETTDILEEIMQTPATTQAGALAKLRISAAVWPETRPAEHFEFHEEVARDAVLDAVRLFTGLRT